MLNWYDRDVSDFEDSDTGLSHQTQEDDHTKRPGRRKITARREHALTVRRERALSDSEDDGLVYPLDLWHVLARHIMPEDVQVFACICRGAHLVVQTANFWHSLYARFYSSSAPLHDSLRPRNMRKVHGLRARVIRTLFHVYAPFRTRAQATAPFRRSPDTLEGSLCMVMWCHRLEKDLWHFYFKFDTDCRGKTPRCCRRDDEGAAHWDIDSNPADVHYNTEEHCCVVCVVTPNYMFIPPSVIGRILQSASVSVSRAMRYHKLKLLFSSQFMRSTKDAARAGCTVVMDPVLNIHLLHWWHPRYLCR